MLTLIVDDSQTNLLYLEALSRRLAGQETVAFDCPKQGLAWCHENEPDLVLLDHMMPEMDGLTFLKAFRRLPGRETIPVVMVTAANERELRIEALEAGATDFLAKPVDPAEFRARSRNLLALRASEKALGDRAVLLAREVAEATAEIEAREIELILRLSRAAEFRDPETGAHIQRMAHYSALVAERLGQDQETVTMMLRAAPMHDIGKLGIPDSILLKPGRLTAPEQTVMRGHAQIGWQILSGSTSPLVRFAAVIALGHHERFDGTGYPSGLAGTAIPVEARIVAIADVFDALTSARPYKSPWSMETARRFLIDNRGRHFDPECVDAFLAAWGDVQAIHDRFQD